MLKLEISNNIYEDFFHSCSEDGFSPTTLLYLEKRSDKICTESYNKYVYQV